MSTAACCYMYTVGVSMGQPTSINFSLRAHFVLSDYVHVPIELRGFSVGSCTVARKWTSHNRL